MPEKGEMENVWQLDSISLWSDENILERASCYDYATYEEITNQLIIQFNW